MSQYHKYIRITNLSIHERNTEDLVEWIHRLEVGNIFDLVVFHPYENRTTTTANLTLWNMCRTVRPSNIQEHRDVRGRVPRTFPGK